MNALTLHTSAAVQMPLRAALWVYSVIMLVSIALAPTTQAQTIDTPGQFGVFNPVQFGRANAQYQTFEWNSLQSRNFDVYYHQGGEYLAQYAAIVVEEHLQTLQRTLNFIVGTRIPVIVYNSYNEFLQTNSITTLLPRGVGGSTDISKNRVIMPFQGDWGQFRHALRHGLAKAVMNEMFFGGFIQSSVSGSFRVDLPEWMQLGFAEYMAAGGYTTKADSYVRDLILNQTFPSLATLNTDASNQMRAYIGQAFFAFIATKYGTGKVGEILNRVRAVGTLENAFRGAFGMTTEPFWRLWQQELQQQYRADAARFQDASAFGVHLIDSIANLHTSTSYVSSGVISPNGDKAAFASTQHLNEGSEVALKIFDMKTRKLQTLMTLGSVADDDILYPMERSITWKPDGSRLAVSVPQRGQDVIVILNPTTGEKTVMDVGFKIINALAWSPDGKMIAFSAAVNEFPNIYVMELATRKVRKVTNDIFSELAPVWAWDSKTLFFISERGKVHNSPTQQPATQAQANVTASKGVVGSSAQPTPPKLTEPAPLSAPMWEYDVTQSDVYSVSLATGRIERLTNDPQNRKTSIAVAPNNLSVFITSDKNGISNLYQFNLLTKELTPKTSSLYSITSVSMPRDGSVAVLQTTKRGVGELLLLAEPLKRKVATPLGVTAYRKDLAERDEAAGRTIELLENREDSVPSLTQREPLKGYGNVDIDFSRQKMVFPDVETATAIALSEQLAQETDTTTLGKLPSRPYKLSLANDYFTVNPIWDTFVQFRFAVQGLYTDIMGDHRVFGGANFQWNFQNTDLYLSYAYLPNVIDYEANYVHTWRLLTLFEPSIRNYVVARLAYWGLGGRAILPLNAASRLEGSLRWINTSRETVDDARVPQETRMLFVPELRYVFDDTKAGVYAPSKGSRGYVALDASGLGVNALSFVRLIADYRRYVPIDLPWKNAATLAVRGAAGVSIGGAPQRFFVGGMENQIFYGGPAPFERAEDLVFMVPGQPLRGFDVGVMTGTRYVATNVELRIPISQNVSAGPVSGLLQNVQAALFVDAGSAWTNDFTWDLPEIIIDQTGNPTPPIGGSILMSVGVGVRFFIIGIPLKVDMAFLNLRSGLSAPRFVLSWGVDF